MKPVEQIMPDSKRLDSIDGLRGIAVIMVLCTHFCDEIWETSLSLDVAISRWDHYFFRFTQGLGIGVDLFFVISGFLITSILIATREKKKYFYNFYVRRGLRIFPLYYFCLLWLIGYSLLSGNHVFPSQGEGVSAFPGPYFLLHFSNFQFIQHGWGDIMVNPMYSLAMEEQYYLFFPLVVWALSRAGLYRFLLGTLLFSVLFRAAVIYLNLDERFFEQNERLLIYCNVLGRADGLAFGGLAAMLHQDGRLLPWRRFFPIALGVMGLLYAGIFVYTKGFWPNSWPGIMGCFGYTFVGLSFFLLLGSLLTGSFALLNRTMESKVFVKVGFYSYSIYLFHNFLHVMVRDYLFDATKFSVEKKLVIPVMMAYSLIMLGVSFVFALGTWSLVEGPCIRLKKYFRYSASGGESK